jgi:hypothetical protein
MITLTLDSGTYAVCQFTDLKDVPPRVGDAFYSLTLTDNEISLVCAQELVPQGTRCECGWRILRLEGPFDFNLVGILSGILAPLAQAEVSIFAISTYDTDYVLIRKGGLEQAVAVLRAAGYQVNA